MRDDRLLLASTLDRYPRPRMAWRSIIAALALEAFAVLMIGAVVWRLVR